MNTKEHRNKILFIITDFGSFNNFLSEIALDMTEIDGYEVHVICSESKVINFADKFDYSLAKSLIFHFLPIPRGLNIFKQLHTSWKINSLIKRINPDLVHAHFTTAIFTTCLLKPAASQYRFWGTFHGLGYVVSSGFKKILFKTVEYYCFLKLGKILLLNQEDLRSVPDLFSKKAYLSRSKGLGCDLDIFDPRRVSAEAKLRLKEDLSITKEYVIAYTGRFVHFKGFDLLIRVFITLTKLHPGRFKLVLIGGRDKIHATGLSPEEEEELATNPSIVDVGFTSKVELFLSIADVFVFPSKKEGVPISITEALAMKIPVVTFDSRGCRDLVSDNLNGRLIKMQANRKEEEKEFVSAIEDICLDRFRAFDAAYMEATRTNYSRRNFIIEQKQLYKGIFQHD